MGFLKKKYATSSNATATTKTTVIHRFCEEDEDGAGSSTELTPFHMGVVNPVLPLKK